MMPSTWEPHYRYDDGELVGYLEPLTADQAQPRTIFGYPLGEPTSPLGAEQRLEESGLSCLAEDWGLDEGEHGWRRVRIVEVRPDHLTLINWESGGAANIGDAIRLAVPVPDGRLRPWRQAH